MTRKEASFGQLLGYMNREADNDRYALRHNLYSRGESALADEFGHNAALLRKRSNGVVLYHEILSITKTARLSDHALKDRLLQIARAYVAKRAPEALVYGVVHDDHEHHLHYHLLISANAVGDAERIRLSKAEFQRVKHELEERVMEQFPELEQSVSMNKPEGEALSRKGGELKRRTGETPERDALKERATRIFETAMTKDELFAALQAANIELYTRGKTIGVRDLETGRKHRLKTIGLWPAFEALDERLSQPLEENEPLSFEAIEPIGTDATQDFEAEKAEQLSAPESPALPEEARRFTSPLKVKTRQPSAIDNTSFQAQPRAGNKRNRAEKQTRTSLLEKGAAGLWDRTKALYSELRKSLAKPEFEITKPAQKTRPDGRSQAKPENKNERSALRTKTQTNERASESVFKQKKKPRRIERQTERSVESEIDRRARERSRELRKKTAHLRERNPTREDGNEQ